MWGGFDGKRFSGWIVEKGAFRVGDFTLKSGRMAPYYVNCRVLSDTAQGLEVLTNHILDFVVDNNLEPDCFYGVPDGMTKTATVCNYRWALSRPDFYSREYVVPQGRKSPKEHGDPRDRFFVTPPEGRTLVLEDVVTTGGSLLGELDKIGALGNVEVLGVVVLVDRLEKSGDGRSVRDLVEERGVPYYPMTDVTELIKRYGEEKGLDDRIRERIRKYLWEYGIANIEI